jgi:hypothetical protein
MAIILRQLLPVSKRLTKMEVQWSFRSGSSSSSRSISGSVKQTDFNSQRALKVGKKLSVDTFGFEVWLFKKKFYKTTDFALTSDDVVALLNEESNKRRLQLEKAHSL